MRVILTEDNWILFWVTILVLLTVAIVGGAGYGYVHNIVLLAGMPFDAFSVILVLRIVGIFVPFLGIIMGFI